MFLPNSHSFLLTQGTIIEPGFAPEARRGVFLPNSHSFLLIRSAISKPVVQPGIQESATRRKMFLSNTDSFLLRRQPIVESGFTPETVCPVGSRARDAVASLDDRDAATSNGAIPQSTDSEQPEVKNQGKRNFLKVAGVAGAGLAASLLLPKKADAFIMGSSPTTGVVGVKNSTNTRINPATEETVSTLATQATAATLLKTSDLTFDTGSLQVKVAAVSGDGSSSFRDSGGTPRSALVDADRHVQVDVLSSSLPTTASTETTLQTISFGGFKFTLRLATVGDIDYVGEATIGTATSAASWRIKRVDSSSGTVIQWAGTGVFDQVWDNRASLSYS